MTPHAFTRMAKAHQADILRDAETQRLVKQIGNNPERHLAGFPIVGIFRNIK